MSMTTASSLSSLPTSSASIQPLSIGTVTTRSSSGRSAVCPEFAVAERVDVELHPRHIVGLDALAGLEVDDDDLVGVELADEVDPPVNDEAVSEVDLYLLLDELDVLELIAVVAELSRDG